MSISQRLLRTITRYRMLRPKDKVLLGVSGGPDSLALLFLCDELRKRWGIRVYVAHLNHGLRKAADRDMLFVQGLCKKMNVPFIGRKIDARKLRGKGSLEENCRKARLKFLIRTARKNTIGIIGLGHNLDDQAETVLMRLLRGSGLSGLSGILPKRKIEGVTFIRPLIEIERREIETFLKEAKVKPRRDRTNKESVYFRNRIRNRLLPRLISGYNPNLKAVLASTAQIISADYDYLYGQALQALKDCATFSAKTARINLRKFTALHPAMQRILLRVSIEKIKGNTRRLTFQHFRELEGMIKSQKSGGVVNLPGRIVCKKEAKNIRLSVTNS